MTETKRVKLVLLLALEMYFVSVQHAYSLFVFLDAGALLLHSSQFPLATYAMIRNKRPVTCKVLACLLQLLGHP